MVRITLRLIFKGRTLPFSRTILLCIIINFLQMPIRINKLIGLTMPDVSVNPAAPQATRLQCTDAPFQRLRTHGPPRGMSNPRLLRFCELERAEFIFTPRPQVYRLTLTSNFMHT